MVYCGTDIIEVDRIKSSILDNDKFLRKIFTVHEINEVEKTKGENKYQRYAARFAAKEAIYKALSQVFSRENVFMEFTDVQIENDKKLNGRPRVNFINETLRDLISREKISIDISLSHVKEYAIAFAVAEK